MSEILQIRWRIFLFWRNLKNEDSRAKKCFFVGSKKEVKKVIRSKNDSSKKCPKFCKLGDEFFYFIINEDSRAKKRFFVGSQKKVKKVIKSKNGWSKSCPKFCKLGDEFFLFWRNLKNEDSTAKKRFFWRVQKITG